MRWLAFALVGLWGAVGSSRAQSLERLAFAQLDSAMQQPRPVVVLVTTSWCRYCALMRQTTLRDPEVIWQLNQRFYFVELDAEQREPVHFKGTTYAFRPTGQDTGLHDLAATLAEVDGTVTYPTVVMLNPQYEIVFQHPGALTAAELLRVLRQL
ncbi:Thioredoxin-related protein [Catalinimonas alkaloidigena]|uniref:Thioredoxin-related protein n=2 Tax=Catalinimonas alkaloidigena TaxID=1075417 RepID=A0A1G9UM97_9BACT|nr:Thioredoxin-related protein [Catalinimonas alkaloidigena]